jgi:hypothetical protein
MVALIGGCTSQAETVARQADSGSVTNVVDEARAFMADYARDLLAGDRAAIAARYDRTGAYFLGNGRKQFSPYDSVVAQYRGPSWAAPAKFDWRELTFEPAGPDAVVVAGQFLWATNPRMPGLVMSYTAFLRRQDGVLRIRIEDESFDPTSVPAPSAVSDSARR